MKVKSWSALPLLLALTFVLNGCAASRYVTNRAADLRDIFQLGVGLTTENPKTGVWPPTLGIYAQVTEFINLGAVTFHGKTWEIDGRGVYAGPESRTRIGILPYQEVQIDQKYAEGSENYYKKPNTLWADRMNSAEMRWWRFPAKQLDYEAFSISRRNGSPVFHRGWQYWENINLEIGIPEPFITHFGLNLKIGFDPSEIFDCVLGLVCIDFKRDDLNREEYAEYLDYMDVSDPSADYKPASDAPPAPAAPQE